MSESLLSSDLELPFGLPVKSAVAGTLGALSTAAFSTDTARAGRNERVHRLCAELAMEGVSAGGLVAAGMLHDLLRAAFRHYTEVQDPGSLARALAWVDEHSPNPVAEASRVAFNAAYPTSPAARADQAARELSLLFVCARNPALEPFRPLFDNTELTESAPVTALLEGLKAYFDAREPMKGAGVSLFDALLLPLRAAPTSLEGQLAFIMTEWADKNGWGDWLPDELRTGALLAVDILAEQHRERGFGPGEVPVMRFDAAPDAIGDPEHEAFSKDEDWMSNLVLMAKSTWVWLDQLSREYERDISRLDQIPDEALDRLARWGFNGLWLIGLWERSDASAQIKRRTGNPEAVSSAYSLYDYAIADALGGDEAYGRLKARAEARGIRLAADMVPNHVGIYSKWVVENPDWFLGLDEPPYPGYRFDGPDLSEHPDVGIHLEDGYWDKSDAAVVFRRTDKRTGDARYIYHGNDGTHMPWNDTAQLNYLNPEAREAVIQTILEVARRFPVIRFDAAMTLARRHIRRLWWPEAGQGGAIPSRAERTISRAEFDRLLPKEFWREVVDRVAEEAPDTLLLAEAFWMMEGYFVRTLGMHRVYNSAFMNMIRDQENDKYRATLRNVLEFSPEVLKRFVNFQNNPDEEPAAVGFGTGDKYFGACLLMVTLPGLPMFGHGQVEGLAEKYGMEYRRAYWDEAADDALVARHEREIFPLMRRRYLFSQAEHFALFDLVDGDGHAAANVFAYCNGAGDERALVVYNNAYEQAAGHLKHSTSINRGTADEPTLESIALAAALGVHNPAAVVVGFVEHMSGMAFLRTGEQLERDGLFVMLDGYQYQVFVDFTVHAEGSWHQLCAELDGASVPSLADAHEDMQLRSRVAELTLAVAELVGTAEVESEAGETVISRVAEVAALLHSATALKPRHLRAAVAGVLVEQDADLACVLALEPDPAALGELTQRYLGANEHQGVVWFNKERAEALVAMWARVQCLEATEAERQAIEARADALAEAITRSGYRLSTLEEALVQLN